MNQRIRILQLSDAPLLAEHSRRIMATSGLPPTPLFTAVSRHRLPSLEDLIARTTKAWSLAIGQPNWGRCFALFDEAGVIRGEVGFKTGLESTMHRGWLWLGLEPEYRGGGNGRRLMEALIDWCVRETDLAWLDLGVFAHNHAARRLYENLGFLEVGRRQDQFRVDGLAVENIDMALELRQIRWTRPL